MASYDYNAVDLRGKLLAGSVEAATLVEARGALERDGLTLISTTETRVASEEGWRALLRFDRNPAHVTAFTLDLAMMLKGGLTLDEGLQILAETGSRAWLTRLVAEMRADLSTGKPFSAVLARHPREFPMIYVQTVAVAETSGRLAEALDDLASERARSERLKRKLFSAVAYPAFLLAASLATLCFVLLYVIPQFEGALEGFQDKLSPSTRFVFDLSRWFRDNAPTIAVASMAALALALIAGRLKSQNVSLAGLFGRLPVVRAVFQQETTITFCRTIAILLANGVAVTAALRLARDVVRSPSAKSAIDLAISDIRGGERLSSALAARAVLPPAVTQMLRVGEEAGRIADSANRIATFYEAKLDIALSRLTAVIGPVMMIAVAFLIAWLIVSVMTALVGVNDILS